MNQAIQETEITLTGFCPQVLESFLMGAEVVFGGHDELCAVLEHLRAGQFIVALGFIKRFKYRSNAPERLIAAVERRVYASMCPHH